MTPRQRLTELGIALPDPVVPLAAYVPAVRFGSFVFTSGQLPTADGTLHATGHVGAEISVEQAHEWARLCAVNTLAAIDTLVGVDSVIGFVSSAPGFTEQPQVVNGASELFGEVFGDLGRHARSVVGVAKLPLDAGRTRGDRRGWRRLR